MKNIEYNINDYWYLLPEEKIAKYPLQERDQSKLLIYKEGKISEKLFSCIPDLLTVNDQFFINDTKVIRARLLFLKSTGAKIEIFCLEPVYPKDYQLAFGATNSCIWKCLIGNASKWKQGSLSAKIETRQKKISLTAERIDKKNGLVQFTWDSNDSFGEILDMSGAVPIPPYLNRESEKIDSERYQTVYSNWKGSVAAPTAGLHFTENVLNKIGDKGISINPITLHVGAGTFKPVSEEDFSQHKMHTEHFIIQRDTLEKLLDQSKRNIAVGTTSVRTLESIYWLGLKQMQNSDTPETFLHLNQWDWKKLNSGTSLNEVLTFWMHYMDETKKDFIEASTQIMITPGYSFKFVDVLITNYHQPKSTLLLLIAAFVGENWKKIYDYALNHDFRFLSYGDSSILFRT